MPRTGLSASEIKEKAIDLTMVKMRKEGFDQVRLSDITKDIGLSHAALYSHFKDKSALFDAVSERWLLEIDANLEAVCLKNKEPSEKILLWMLTLHRAKVAKVMHDPELYKAFDLSVAVLEPFAKTHLETMHRQLLGMVKECLSKRRLREANAEVLTEILKESMMAFHHPKLVVQHIHEKREPLLKLVLESVLKGLDLKA